MANEKERSLNTTKENFDKVGQVIEEILAADPYTSYIYVAQNRSVEQERATKHARSWMRQLAERLTTPSATRESVPLRVLRSAGCREIGGRTVGYCLDQLKRGRLMQCATCSAVDQKLYVHDENPRA